jgi:hypothetical protein
MIARMIFVDAPRTPGGSRRAAARRICPVVVQ